MSTYKKRVEAGLCGKCGKKPEKGSMCNACREKEKIKAAAKREKRRKAGTCINCSKPTDGGAKCERCKQLSKESRERAVTKRKATGQCVSCSLPAKPGRTMCQTCIDKRSAVSSEHFARRKEEGTCCYCSRPLEPGSTMCSYHIDKTAVYRRELKREVLDAYGGAQCCHCGEQDLQFLEVDHTEGGGNFHRKEVASGGGGHGFYQWLKRNNFPPGFRVLCRTCNAKAHVDRCRENGNTTNHAYLKTEAHSGN